MENCKEVDSKIINIHWPEALYNWNEPSRSQLNKLEEWFKEIKKTKLIVYTKHDRERTKGSTPNFNRLFQIVEKNTDVFIHLGNRSKTFYKKKYSLALHKLIYHPVFKISFEEIGKDEARRKLGIDSKATVIIAPGNIRHNSERKLILNAFKRLKLKNKVLICTNMRNELKIDFPGRVRLQKFFDIQQYVKKKFESGHQPPKYLFNYSPMSQKELKLRVAAADIVIIPRVDILNSGIVFLAASFQKVAVGPATGNITEVLKEQNLPIFNPYSISSVRKALSEGIDLLKKGNFHWRNMDKYQPEFVANEYDRIFSEIIKNEA